MSDEIRFFDDELLFNRAVAPLGWTGGQYSLYRLALGIWLALVTWYFVPGRDWCTSELPLWWQGPLEMSNWHRGALSVLAVLIAIGWFDRIAAGLAVVVAFSVGWGIEWRVIQVLLATHALSQGAPFGSLAAIGRVDPGGGWRRSPWNAAFASLPALYLFPLLIHFFTWQWTFDALENAPDWVYQGAALLLALVCVPLVALSARFHWMLCIAWILFCALVFYMACAGFGGLNWGTAIMSLIALAAFDPGMIRGRRGTEPEIVYYDGDCGLCHRIVRFLLSEDTSGDGFRFAALQSDHFAQHVSDVERARLGDSVIVRTSDGRLLQRTAAVVHLMLALGGLWRILGSLIWCIPLPLRDLVYVGIAKVRKRLFPAPKGLCPLIPAELGKRFVG